jgi:hypothetical protein
MFLPVNIIKKLIALGATEIEMGKVMEKNPLRNVDVNTLSNKDREELFKNYENYSSNIESILKDIRNE